MRMKSRKALELCRECRERLLLEISTVEQEKSPNYKIMGAAVDVILKLNIQELLGVTPEDIQKGIEKGIEKLKKLRSLAVAKDEKFSKAFVTGNIDIMLKSLSVCFIPDSNIWLGTDQAAEEAVRRLEDAVQL